MNHLDLFSGIGGFALAAREVWGDEYKTVAFCDNDYFCQQVLEKNFPEVPIYGDIRTVTAYSKHNGKPRPKALRSNSSPQSKSQTRQELPKSELERANSLWSKETRWDGIDLLTGGFPCQPFSQAGRKRGKEDDRYLWPEMLRVIKEFQPTWIIGENVAGIINMALEQVCTDLEGQGYEVQPVIIPAVAVNAPHRRDRVWIIAYYTGNTKGYTKSKGIRETESKGLRGYTKTSWERNWVEVATELCRMDDGLSKRLVRLPDGNAISYPRWRREALKAYGNAIVPQVVMEIMKGIKESKGG